MSTARQNPRTVILTALAAGPLPRSGGNFTNSLTREVWFACLEGRPRAHRTPALRVVRRHLQHLRKEGRVVRLADGRYALAPGSGEPYAVVIVVMHGSRVLLCQGPRWCLPGGKVERKRGEDAVHAAWREGKEELDVVVSLRGGEDGPEPFFRGHTHDGRTLWAFRGHVPDGTPDARWDAPEGWCEFVEVLAAPALYRQDLLAAFCRVMRALPDPLRPPQAVSAYLLHLEGCAQCQAAPTRLCETGSWIYASAIEGVDDACE